MPRDIFMHMFFFSLFILWKYMNVKLFLRMGKTIDEKKWQEREKKHENYYFSGFFVESSYTNSWIGQNR